MSVDLWVAAFEEWKRRYDADPEGFGWDFPEGATYGERAAAYFASIIDELTAPPG